MNTYLTMKWLVSLSITMLMLVATVLPVAGEDRLVEGAMILAPVKGPSRTEKISEDTLEACLARIPERVTPEERMMSQQQCHEEEVTRTLEPLTAVKGD